MAQSYTDSTLTPQSHPYTLYAITSRPPGSTKHASIAGASRDPIQILCPYTGSNLTSAHSLRVPVSSSVFGVRCLLPVPLSRMMCGGGDHIDNALFVGHGGGGTGNKDDHAFLLNTTTNGGGSNPRWKVRLPESLSNTPQSMVVSPCGRYLVAGCTSGNCYLWSWTQEDNLLRVWKAHYRPVTCCVFDEEGGTFFTGGDDGVVNAWSLLDLVDEEQKRQIHPFRTWSEHHLPVAAICVLKGSGVGCTRLVSCSLDRHLIFMEVGGASFHGGLNSMNGGGDSRTLARMCLPSGLHCVISDSLSSRLYAAGADGNIYCVDMDRYAIHETLDGTNGGAVVHVNQTNKSPLGVDFESILLGNHVIRTSSTPPALLDQSKYVSELKGHAKAVVSLALLDPADLTSTPVSTKSTCLLASGSQDGTLRVWDLRSRTCVKVLRPWTPSSEGLSITSNASAMVSPPITSLIAVPKSSLTCTNSSLTMVSIDGSRSGKRSAHDFDIAAIFKPLKRFIRGSSTLHDDESKNKGEDDCYVMIFPQANDSSGSFWNDYYSEQTKRAKT